ncbi:MAG: DUF1592 domain-containing protein [Gemmataceae bacterium]
MSPAPTTPFLAAWAIAALTLMAPCATASEAGDRFRKDVQPILAKYCYDCHANGLTKGNVTLDGFKSDDLLLKNRDLWLRALKNVRTGLMPPAGEARLTDDEQQTFERWIKADAFGIDSANPDPGRVTLRRLNRTEYRNTVRDLTGYDFKTDEEFPPDDTGYGFDTIGDVLTVSPLLLEKYVDAARTIATAAVPRVAKVVREQTVPGTRFERTDGGPGTGDRFTFYKPATFARTVTVEKAGDYRLVVELIAAGGFNFNPARCRITFSVDGQERLTKEFGWENGKRFSFPVEEKWQPGDHTLAFAMEPLIPPGRKPPTTKEDVIDMRIAGVRVQGPLDRASWVHPPGYDHFFFADEPPTGDARKPYAREVLARFGRKAFRRPVDDRTIDRLTTVAEGVYSQPGKLFEDGIAEAVVAVLASPRFLFRVEAAEPTTTGHPLVDEYALAARLSYFLWSTTPDDELCRLADQHELRKNLSVQVKRMLADPRTDSLVRNFVGQWLQARDVEGVSINARAVIRRDGGSGFTRIDLDGELRRAMRQETEMHFGHILREGRSARELIDCDYAFLNEKLANHYGIPGVTGPMMRKVTLPKDSPRGGVLTQGTILTVTSNPTRTSPVKRGLFILDNVLGSPAPPAPADVPQLEDSEKEFKGREPTTREAMEVHRNKPLCAACHSRMDPLGLALENFNALGMFREKERGKPVDVAGKLLSGESFTNVRELKHILTTERRQDYYRCLTEKLLTYALGRGPEYYDTDAVDRIVERLNREDGRVSALVLGVIESVPFQRRRK